MTGFDPFHPLLALHCGKIKVEFLPDYDPQN
jgi:hypothetical protein